MNDLEQIAVKWAEEQSQGDPGWFLTNQKWFAIFMAGANSQREYYRWILAHGCLTGDCPHGESSDCVDSLCKSLHDMFAPENSDV